MSNEHKSDYNTSKIFLPQIFFHRHNKVMNIMEVGFYADNRLFKKFLEQRA